MMVKRGKYISGQRNNVKSPCLLGRYMSGTVDRDYKKRLQLCFLIIRLLLPSRPYQLNQQGKQYSRWQSLHFLKCNSLLSYLSWLAADLSSEKMKSRLSSVSPGVWLANGPLAAKLMFGTAGKVVSSLEIDLQLFEIWLQRSIDRDPILNKCNRM